MTSTTSSSKALFDQLRTLSTEQRNPDTTFIDRASPEDIIRAIHAQDATLSDSIQPFLPQIARLTQVVAEAFRKGGRWITFGAGTSGRLGVLDAAECPPTFGTDPEQVQGFIAGGRQAMFRAQEGAEDDPALGEQDLLSIQPTSDDVICGLAASGRTPYVHGALNAAKRIGATTAMITTVPAGQVTIPVDHLLAIPVGPEVVMGSTRMKSGSAQKMVLNMISTGAMILSGKVYENVMVDLQATNRKLHERSIRTLMLFLPLHYEQASQLLAEAGGHVKTALVMHIKNVDSQQAALLIREADGHLSRIFNTAETSKSG